MAYRRLDGAGCLFYIVILACLFLVHYLACEHKWVADPCSYEVRQTNIRHSAQTLKKLENECECSRHGHIWELVDSNNPIIDKSSNESMISIHEKPFKVTHTRLANVAKICSRCEETYLAPVEWTHDTVAIY